MASVKLFTCHFCNKEFSSKKADKNRIPKFCSSTCYSESLKKFKPCPQCGISFAKCNVKFCSIECSHAFRRDKPLSMVWRKALSEGRKKSVKCKGENLYNYKGGNSTINQRHILYFHKRKSALNQPPNQEFLLRILQAQNNQCFYCEADLTNYKAIEHLTPPIHGGTNENFNLVYSCKSCNSKKRQLTLEQFAIRNNRFDLLDKWEYIYSEAI